jgi:hypothetical protein
VAVTFVRRVAVAVVLLGLAILLWPLDGAHPRSSALYPNYDHLIEGFPVFVACADPPSTGCGVGYFVEDSVTERRITATTLLVLGGGVLLTSRRRRGDDVEPTM